jgi:fermentation-respiration switch protein FrsA (DUF1100 family)
MKNILYLILILLLALPITATEEDKNAEKKTAMKFVYHLRDGQYKAAYTMFDSSVIKVFRQEQLKDVWEGLVRENGFFEKITTFREDRDSAYSVVFVNTSFLRRYAEFTCTVNRDQKLLGFRIYSLTDKADAIYPPYADSSKIQSEDITFGIKDWELRAKLTMPVKPNGKLPAVILIHGSGSQDMDQSIGKLKPFWDLATGLSSRGIAVLRYNKRTTDHPYKFMRLPTFTVKEEATDDVIEAVKLLKKDPRIDSNRIYLLGHSLGGYLVPRIAQQVEVAGIVSMAGPARPFGMIIYEQVMHKALMDDNLDDQEAKYLENLKKQTDLIDGPDLTPEVPYTELPFNIPAEYYLDYRDNLPVLSVIGLELPILIMQGGKDFQVTEEDFNIWKAALSDHERKNFKFYPEVNHLFIEIEGDSSPADIQKPAHVSPEVINDLVDWIEKN